MAQLTAWPLAATGPAGPAGPAGPQGGIGPRGLGLSDDDDPARFDAVKAASLNILYPEFADLVVGGNWSPALAAAVAALPARGGDILFPPGAYRFDDGIDFDESANVRLVGAGSRYGGADVAQVKLEWTGAGTFISARSSYGFQLERLYISGFALGAGAVLINLDKATAVDTVMFGIRDCWLRGTNNGNGILVSLANAHSGAFEGVTFHGGARAVRGRTVPGDFSNSITFDRRCYFQYSAAHPILNPGQAWVVSDAVFEPLQGGAGPAGAIEVQNTFAVEQIAIEDCSFQDSVGGGTWVILRGNGVELAGNFFNTGAIFVQFVGAVDGVDVRGNTFGGGAGATTAAIDCGATGVTNFDDAGNRWAGNAADIIGKVNADLGGVLVSADGPTPATTGAAWPSANRSIFVRYVPRVTHTAAGIAYHVTVGDGANPAVDVAALDGSRNRLASSGSTVGKLNAPGVQFVAFTASIVMRKGVTYYVGMGSASATPQLAWMLNLSTGTTAEIISNATPNLLQGLRDANVPIANPTAALSSVASVPLMCVRTN